MEDSLDPTKAQVEPKREPKHLQCFFVSTSDLETLRISPELKESLRR